MSTAIAPLAHGQAVERRGEGIGETSGGVIPKAWGMHPQREWREIMSSMITFVLPITRTVPAAGHMALPTIEPLKGITH